MHNFEEIKPKVVDSHADIPRHSCPSTFCWNHLSARRKTSLIWLNLPKEVNLSRLFTYSLDRVRVSTTYRPRHLCFASQTCSYITTATSNLYQHSLPVQQPISPPSSLGLSFLSDSRSRQNSRPTTLNTTPLVSELCNRPPLGSCQGHTTLGGETLPPKVPPPLSLHDPCPRRHKLSCARCSEANLDSAPSTTTHGYKCEHLPASCNSQQQP